MSEILQIENNQNQKQYQELLLEVGTISTTEFFDTDTFVTLPDYQRPYVWNTEKLKQLLKDFKDHFFTIDGFNDNAPHYYLGCVLLYQRSQNEFEIIDGQQRITSLLILDHSWNEGESYLSQKKWNLEYSSMLSTAVIKQNYSYLKENVDLQIKKHIKFIFSKLVFTVIKTNSEDEAFTFFDSQNSRGVSLSAVDFLKSYHLRELKGKEDLQRLFAKQWDSNNKAQFLTELFDLILWRSRSWKGSVLTFENKDAILKDFQKKTIKEKNNDVIRLYPNIFNALANQLAYDSEVGASIRPNILNLQTRASDYPFSIRQPIQKGIGFFLYTEKYYAIYNQLFFKKNSKHFTKVYDKLLSQNSNYLKTFFRLASVVYYDKFKDDHLIAFALWMDYLLGSYRINQKTIVTQTVLKILKENSQNLLDVIEMAYRPEEVFHFIRSITNDNHYGTDLTNDARHGVRMTYQNANFSFYKKENNTKLTSKKSWIYEYLETK
ncbi:DUF262 domain-containing protein [Flavobacterium sp. F-328]|uniref:DUF262 domain-containing protein n=1 Tax=Flavobacterium erciyesense TaxID=2825842 RepID=A0ABS5D6X7_9FLAO|nr:DUF262 domain-containing protein [Flavobacterium erciyesense]MBQ0909753.1 DUF262 domain-containing protein [Flavobacterium erciyesense]